MVLVPIDPDGLGLVKTELDRAGRADRDRGPIAAATDML
jgi:hypothetical protein